MTWKLCLLSKDTKKLECVVCKYVFRVLTRIDTMTLCLQLCCRISNPLYCFADMDSCASVGSQWWFLLWLCAALQFALRDMQSPHQPFGGGNTSDVPASLLYHVCSYYCDGSVTQVHTPTLKYTMLNAHTTHIQPYAYI